MTQRMHRLLVIEDDAALRAMLQTLLESQQYRVVTAESGRTGLVEARANRPDLVLVDLGLPDADGLEVIRAVRAFAAVPILVLTVRTMESEKVRALDAGADDYVTKPFGAGELLARVRAALRRVVAAPDSAPVCFGEVSVDLVARSASQRGEPLHLTPLEFRLLACLHRHAGLIVTQQQLIREVWGPGRTGDARGLRTYVKFLRQKLEPDPGRPRYLLTEAGVGYRLMPDEPVDG
jgi:two-component system KDP operon response regulator KdpE